MPLDFSGQVGIVTGGGRGIGRAMAQMLAQAGMAVAVCARSEQELHEAVAQIRDAGGNALAFPLDVTDPQAVTQMVNTTHNTLGPIDLLVNNAGVVQPLGPIWEVDAMGWWRNQEVNVLGPLLCAKAVLPDMLARRQGRIVNVVSSAGLTRVPYGSAYGVAKTALLRFSENLAADTRESGVAVFAMNPGTTKTAMTDYLYSSDAAHKYLPWFRDFFDHGDQVVPMEAITRFLGLLASGKADSLSGCCIGVLDDIDALVEHAEQIQDKGLYALRMGTL